MNSEIPVILRAFEKKNTDHEDKNLPLELNLSENKAICEKVLQELKKVGLNNFKMILREKSSAVKLYFKYTKEKYDIEFLDSPVNGDLNNIKLACNNINNSFLVMDSLSIPQLDIYKLYEIHKNDHNILTLVCKIEIVEIPFESVEIDNGNICLMENNPRFTFFKNTGIFMAEPEILDFVSMDKPTSIWDIIKISANNNKKVGTFVIYE